MAPANAASVRPKSETIVAPQSRSDLEHPDWTIQQPGGCSGPGGGYVLTLCASPSPEPQRRFHSEWIETPDTPVELTPAALAPAGCPGALADGTLGGWYIGLWRGGEPKRALGRAPADPDLGGHAPASAVLTETL